MDATDITGLLAAARAGQREAIDLLLPQVYERLRRLAHRQLAGEGPHTLGTTALVHEAWFDLAGQAGGAWRDRAQFFAYAGTAMRHILVDYARRRGAQKRGGGALVLDWHEQDLPVDDVAAQMLALDEALTRLGELDPRLAQVVELRFFAGLSVEEAAEVLGITARSVVRDWRRARAFLHVALESPA